MENNMRRSSPLFSMNAVMKLTGLTARQIRYYEENELIEPHRTEGNRRMFSLNDIDRLLEIKELIDQGLNMAGIKQILGLIPVTKEAKDEEDLTIHHKKDFSDEDLRNILKEELIERKRERTSEVNMRQGDMWRFFKP